MTKKSHKYLLIICVIMSYSDNAHDSKKSYKALSSDRVDRKIPVRTCSGFVCPSGNLRIWATKQEKKDVIVTFQIYATINFKI